MNLLVIGSCTGDKDVRDCPHLLGEADFDDPDRLRRRESELARWKMPAARLYTGWQHRYMMKGVDVLRDRFGAGACAVQIISAGYGLVREEQLLVPYEATFQGKRPNWIRERAARLGIPKAVRDATGGFSLVVFLLGKEYLLSLNLPMKPRENQRLIFFSSNPKLPLASRSTVVPAGKPETRFGGSTVALKGRMFHLLAFGIAHNPATWDDLMVDDTPSTALNLIREGLKHA